MDIISHGLYGGIGFGRKNKRAFIIAFLFGILPDALSFGIYFVLGIFGVIELGTNGGGPPDPKFIPHFVYIMYDITHSLVVFALFGILLSILGKKTLLLLSLGWPLHILIDIPTHDTTFFPTPFLWPISNFTIDGVSWGTPWIFFPNVVLIITLYICWWYSYKKKPSSQKELLK